MAAAEELSLLAKAAVARRTLRNWPLLLPDKLGLARTVRYRTRSGAIVVCRGRSTDVNELVAIHAGLEYPAELLSMRPGANIFDLGANIGAFSLYVAALNPGVPFRLVALEPDEGNAALLRRNVALNRESRITVEQIAVGPTDGWADVETGRGHDQLRFVPAPRETRVRSSRLSTYCAELGISRIDLVKMDIEGAEYAVLEADSEWLAAHVSELLIEYHDLDDERSSPRLAELLAPYFSVDTLHAGLRSGVMLARPRDQGAAGRSAASPSSR